MVITGPCSEQADPVNLFECTKCGNKFSVDIAHALGFQDMCGASCQHCEHNDCNIDDKKYAEICKMEEGL